MTTSTDVDRREDEIMGNAPWQILIAVAISLGSVSYARAQNSVSEFYRGKQVRIIVGFAAGGNRIRTMLQGL